MEAPFVDPAIPLDGFHWDGSRALFCDDAGEYTFDASTSVFRNLHTGKEYIFSTQRLLFLPRPPQTSSVDEAIGGAVAHALRLKEGLKQELNQSGLQVR